MNHNQSRIDRFTGILSPEKASRQTHLTQFPPDKWDTSTLPLLQFATQIATGSIGSVLRLEGQCSPGCHYRLYNSANTLKSLLSRHPKPSHNRSRVMVVIDMLEWICCRTRHRTLNSARQCPRLDLQKKNSCDHVGNFIVAPIKRRGPNDCYDLLTHKSSVVGISYWAPFTGLFSFRSVQPVGCTPPKCPNRS